MPSSSSLKYELADHIYQYLCHEAQYSDLPEAARESLTAASECIEQAYKLNVSQNNNNNCTKQQQLSTNNNCSSNILPDELLRIFTRHKEFISQQKDSINYSSHLRKDDSNESSLEKSSAHNSRLGGHPSNDPHNNSCQATTGTTTNQTTATNNNTTTTTTTSNNNNQSPKLQSTTNASLSNVQQTTSAAAGGGSTSVAATTTTVASAAGHQQPQVPAGTTKQHSQHPISQLPMTTRKKLSHLRAQIKRQASKAARSRLEKRSSVAGVGTSGAAIGEHRHHHPLSAILGHGGCSLDAHNGTHSGSHSKQAGDGYSPKDGAAAANQHLNSSSTESNNNVYLNNPSTSSPSAGGGAGGGGGGTGGPQGGAGGGGASGQGDASGGGGSGANQNVNSSLPSGQQESGSSSGAGHQKHGSHLIPGGHHLGVSVHQKNFKQKLIALIKKFRTDGSDFDSEEQYREALERELMKAAAGRGSRAIEELLEEEIDVEGESGSEPDDWDNISETSTPKPSLRPFFSSTTLDKI